MLFFNIFFALLIVFSNTAMARVAVSSPHEEGPALKRVNRAAAPEHHGAGQSVKRKRSSKSAGNQGKATSSAYSQKDFTIQIDIAADDSAENVTGNAEEGSTSAESGPTGHPKYSTAAGFGAKPISAAALNVAKAKHELKRKLQAENKKKFQLQDVSGEKGQKDPREEIINELMKASQDIEK